MKKITVEEHFYTEECINYLRSRKDWPRREAVEYGERKLEREWWSATDYRLINLEQPNKEIDLGEGRLKDMGESGIDMQVLSLCFPGVELFGNVDGATMAKIINDKLANIIEQYPDRFAGFAAIAPQDPAAAADELERAVKELGLKGAYIGGHVRGEYLDDQKYWGIFERAEKLDVPIYIHPTMPSSDMIRPYLTYPGLAQAMWGFAADAGLHAMRLICSGVFDTYPNLKIILGHLGEALPFWLWRIDNTWQKGPLAKQLKKIPSQYIKDNFFVTTSGMFWPPALQFVISVLGADRILFAVDYPYESGKKAVQFIDSTPISNSEKEKICHLNAEKILRL